MSAPAAQGTGGGVGPRVRRATAREVAGPARRAVLALALLGALAACGGGEGGVAATAPGPWKVPIGTAPQRGPSDAWVTVIEFSDFECPFCGDAAPLVSAILAELPADLRVLYRHFPLPQHPRAVPAALAAECARAQGPAPDGHFWAMHDELFAHQTALLDAHLATYAGRIAGLDTTAWTACLATQPPRDRITADASSASSLGVPGTPTFVVNGTPVVGGGGLRTAVQAALAYARQSGIPRAQYYEKAVLGL